MASVPEIRERLRVVFTEAQAEVLAHVVGEARDDLVTRTDLHELTEVVKQIAEVQKDLAESHKELADAQRELAEAQKKMSESQKEMSESQKEMSEAQRETSEALRETSEALKETSEALKELAEAQKKTELRMEQFAKTQEELFEAQSELFEAQKELTWAMKDTRKQLGGLAQSVGYGLEAYAMERIPRILAKQMAFSEETSGPEQFVSPAGEADDVDVVVRGTLAGRPVVFLCETKTNISPQEIREFLATVGRVRPQAGCDDVRILYFAYRASPEARAAVAEAGGYLAFPHTLLVWPAAAA